MMEKTQGREYLNYKVYVEVGVVYTPEGLMLPKYIRLSPNGEMYVIDRVYRSQRASSRKAGGCGICYSVRVRGQDARSGDRMRSSSTRIRRMSAAGSWRAGNRYG